MKGKCNVPIINVYTDFFINNVWGKEGIDLHLYPVPGDIYILAGAVNLYLVVVNDGQQEIKTGFAGGNLFDGKSLPCFIDHNFAVLYRDLLQPIQGKAILCQEMRNGPVLEFEKKIDA